MDLPTPALTGHTALERHLRGILSPTDDVYSTHDEAVVRQVARSLAAALDSHRDQVAASPDIAPGAHRDDALWGLLDFAEGLGGSAQALAVEVEALLPEYDARLLAAGGLGTHRAA